MYCTIICSKARLSSDNARRNLTVIAIVALRVNRIKHPFLPIKQKNINFLCPKSGEKINLQIGDLKKTILEVKVTVTM